MRNIRRARSVVLGIMLSTAIALPVVYGATNITTAGTYEVCPKTSAGTWPVNGSLMPGCAGTGTKTINKN